MLILATITTLLGLYIFVRAHQSPNDNTTVVLQAIACALWLASAACWVQVL